VSDLVAAHCDALAYLRDGGASATLNCGYGRGFSVLDVIDTVARASTSRSSLHRGGRATWHRSWPPATESVPHSDGSRALTICQPSSLTRWRGSARFRNAPADRQPFPS